MTFMLNKTKASHFEPTLLDPNTLIIFHIFIGFLLNQPFFSSSWVEVVVVKIDTSCVLAENIAKSENSKIIIIIECLTLSLPIRKEQKTDQTQQEPHRYCR